MKQFKVFSAEYDHNIDQIMTANDLNHVIFIVKKIAGFAYVNILTLEQSNKNGLEDNKVYAITDNNSVIFSETYDGYEHLTIRINEVN